jgi:hypothetical protein
MKLSSSLKPLIIAAALAFAGAASAVVLPQLPINATATDFITVKTDLGGSFSDSFGFNVGAASSFSGFAFSSDAQFFANGVFFKHEALNIESVLLSPIGVTANFLGDSTYSYADFSAAYLTPGDYVLTVSGHVAPGSTGGLYGIAATLLPVPEPENYAMLLAGLGFIVARARRKTM